MTYYPASKSHAVSRENDKHRIDKKNLRLFLRKVVGLTNSDLAFKYIKEILRSVEEDNFEIIRRKAKNLKVVGVCNHCGINLTGTHNHPKPETHTMPCNVNLCPFELGEHGNVIDLSGLFGKKSKYTAWTK